MPDLSDVLKKIGDAVWALGKYLEAHDEAEKRHGSDKSINDSNSSNENSGGKSEGKKSNDK